MSAKSLVGIAVWLFVSVLALAGEASQPALLHANIWRDTLDVRDYLVSEKLDGVRAYWDGKQLRFRSGRPVNAPPWFVAGLPAIALDGELWLGRDSFDELSGVVRREPSDDAQWHRVHYMIFDSPQAPGSFAERLSMLSRKLSESSAVGSWVQLIEQVSVADNAALHRKMREVIAGKGEGLMLHRADAAYRAGRNDDLLKLKPQLDTEATLIGYEAGKGRLAGLVGALVMRMPESGHTFRLASGLSDDLRRSPPPLGSQITYRFTSLTKRGLPRFPRYWRVRSEF